MIYILNGQILLEILHELIKMRIIMMIYKRGFVNNKFLVELEGKNNNYSLN